MIPVVVVQATDEAVGVARTQADGGVPVIELTLRALAEDAAEHERRSVPSSGPGGQTSSNSPASGRSVVATVLCAWSHPGRIHSGAAFAMLAGAAPIPANSGQVTTRHLLNRYGDRQLNRALHTIALSRIRYYDTPGTYVARRTSDGKTSREIKRCLKRYIPATSTGCSNPGRPGLDDP